MAFSVFLLLVYFLLKSRIHPAMNLISVKIHFLYTFLWELYRLTIYLSLKILNWFSRQTKSFCYSLYQSTILTNVSAGRRNFFFLVYNKNEKNLFLFTYTKFLKGSCLLKKSSRNTI